MGLASLERRVLWASRGDRLSFTTEVRLCFCFWLDTGLTVDCEERVSTATAYLTPDVIARPNLTVAVGATVRSLPRPAFRSDSPSQVTRILFSDATPTSPPRAIGVEFVSLDIPFPTSTAPRTLYRAKAKKEVILTAGSIGSPHVRFALSPL